MSVAMYVYDTRHSFGQPTTVWARHSPGRCVAYAHRRADGLWYVADLRTGRDVPVAGRIEAEQRLTALAESDPALTIGGAR